MEIERKFKIEKFPDQLPLEYHGFVEQGYLCTEPTVRIRRSTASPETPEPLNCKICIKSKGTLVREEIETPITSDQFDRLAAMLPRKPVTKDFRVFSLPGGLQLEVSLVDEGEPTSFMYAEVEFDSVEAAEAFVPPDYLGDELTYVPGASMSEYWTSVLK